MRKHRNITSANRQRALGQEFVPISIAEYVKLHLKSNPGVQVEDITSRLGSALERKKSGETCACGKSIWAIGSAEVGAMCFTCITGEATPNNDFEIVASK